VVGVLALLLVFGILYNAWVSKKPRVDMEAYVSIYVVIGVGVTLLGFAILEPKAAIIALFCFIASGTPMLLGSIGKYGRQRKYELDTLKKEIEKKK
jgi:hypothetical protein